MSAINRIHQLGITSLTKHCERRMQDRCIPESVVDLLQDFGESVPAGGGTEKFFFTKKSFRKVIRYHGPQAKYFDKYRNAYVIISIDGTVITAGYLH
ncbi:MAG: hypothetical protein RL274_2693 [Pseudomonadota bacterium]